ncbi:uncharacterized protein LOC132717613 isoform X1 [Ruditapes philippinarum]|uniref:uncharacterized protein LOC132717613 isoform X1 n=1 Tax=Ruditapes philippinarum TaxID=129788 RepID=UPI00295AE758|nr:uncharacterized protein LOC132717613 isoform X1 [Ruditapes philippinarum]
MLKTYVTSVVLVIALGLTTITSARYLQDTDDRDKRQIGDLRTAEYLARITLDKNKLLRYLQMPSHCADIACGLVDVFESMVKRTMSDQRIAEIQALIALNRGLGVPVGHGLFDPNYIGKRKKRSLDSVFNGLSDEQKYRLSNILLSSARDDQYS